MSESLYRVEHQIESKWDYDYLHFDDKSSIGEITEKVRLFLGRKYRGKEIQNHKWNMVAWHDPASSKNLVLAIARDNKRYLVDATINMSDIEKLSNDELRVFFLAEDIEDPRTPFVIQNYVLQGKETFTMGDRINEVEKLIMTVITDRFVKGEIK